MTLLDRLKENSDEKLKIFNARLTPSVASERILGVRSPVVKALAKEFYGQCFFSLPPGHIRIFSILKIK